MSGTLLKVKTISVGFRLKGSFFGRRGPLLNAVSGVSFQLREGETLGVVGESGCGKSTLSRAIMRLVEASGRAVWHDGTDLLSLSAPEMLKRRAEMQMIFQDPLASLDPRMQIGDIIAETLRTHRKDLFREQIKARVRDMMARVGLPPGHVNRYPHQFSGGQCQRIGIARALILDPRLLICDEPVSALDVSVRAQIVNLLMDLQKETGLAILFIANDLGVVQHISNRVMVLYLGRVMGIAPKKALYRAPQHPYTQALLSAMPVPDPDLGKAKTVPPLEGELPSPLNPPSGCVFRTRCPRARSLCTDLTPTLAASSADGQTFRDGHRVACHFPGPED